MMDKHGGDKGAGAAYKTPDGDNGYLKGSSSDTGDSSAPKGKGAVRILRRFAGNCSMQGPPYILASTWWLSRSLWTLILLMAMGAMTFHLYFLFQNYFSYATKNSIALGFSSLQFPAVTVCNVNPVRLSQLGLLSADFNDLVKQTAPDQLANRIGNASFAGPLPPPRPRRAANSSDDEDDQDEDDTLAQLDNVDFGLSNFSFSNRREEADENELSNQEGFKGSWQNEGQESSLSRIKRTFQELYATENRGKRVRAGHLLQDMLISCSFAGKSCYASNFTRVTSLTYGNCYTLQYDKFVTRESGPTGGLELLLFVERDEYLEGVTPDDGLKVLIHPQKSMAFPEAEGLAIGGGQNTLLGLKLIQILRMGSPYGDCINDGVFLKKYNIPYTRKACEKFCEQNVVHQQCLCVDETKEDLNIKMGVTLKPCRTKKEVSCMTLQNWKYAEGNVQCGCSNPCIEYKYEKTLSTRPWPNKVYADGVLLKSICGGRVPPPKCHKLKMKGAADLAREFVKLNIFFEDLNYENITESADYEDVQFISDVGGTLGLWIGLSALSFVEIVQLFVELARYLFCCRWRETR